MQQSHDDRSLGDLFSELSRETTTLVRQELSLAKTEMTQRASQVGKDIGYLAVGGAIAYAGFLTLLAALVIVLAEVVPWWLSALIVGVVVAAIGYYLVDKGLDALKQTNMAPQETMESLREDAEWLKDRAG